MDRRPPLHVPPLALALLSFAALSEAAQPSADELDAAITLEWSQLVYDSVRDLKMFPPPAARVIGYFGVTLHEAVAPGRAGGVSLAGQVHGLAGMPQPDSQREHEWRIVAGSAVARYLTLELESYPSKGMSKERTDPRGPLARIEKLRSAQLARCGVGLPADVIARSQRHGEAVGSAIFAWSTQDGFTRSNDCRWTPPKGRGLWVATPTDLRRALQPCWCELRPMALAPGTACAPPPPTPWSDDPGSAYVREALEVKKAVESLSPDQRAIALFWADDRSVSGTPAGHWMLLTAQLSVERKLSLARASEAHARVGIALADAFIACWQTKYEHSYIRPVTAIRESIDPDWMPLLQTPPFPEYTSGHSVASAAAARQLTTVFGTFPYVDRCNDSLGLPARSYESFDAAAKEAAISRLYGGIHFRPAIEHGLEQGDCIARAMNESLVFVTTAP